MVVDDVASWVDEPSDLELSGLVGVLNVPHIQLYVTPEARQRKRAAAAAALRARPGRRLAAPESRSHLPLPGAAQLRMTDPGS